MHVPRNSATVVSQTASVIHLDSRRFPVDPQPQEMNIWTNPMCARESERWRPSFVGFVDFILYPVTRTFPPGSLVSDNKAQLTLGAISFRYPAVELISYVLEGNHAEGVGALGFARLP